MLQGGAPVFGAGGKGFDTLARNHLKPLAFEKARMEGIGLPEVLKIPCLPVRVWLCVPMCGWRELLYPECLKHFVCQLESDAAHHFVYEVSFGPLVNDTM